MEKDCQKTFEEEFGVRGFALAKDDFGYYVNHNTDFAYRGWEAAWKYDEIRKRICNGTPIYTTTTCFTPVDGYKFRIDEEGICHHEEIVPGENYAKHFLNTEKTEVEK